MYLNKSLLKLSLLLMMLFPLTADAIEFSTIDVKNELSNRRAFSTARDSKGFMWFATRTAIDRYDGEFFSHYNFEGMSDPYKIRGVVSDKQGKIYAFTDKYVYSYDEGADAFIRINTLKVKTESIITIHFDNSNALWIGTSASIFYSSNNKNWQQFNFSENKSVFCFCDGNDNEMWIGTNSALLLAVKKSDNSFRVLKKVEQTSNLRSMYYNVESNELWIGTFGDGLFVMKINDLKNLTPISILATNSPVRSISKVSKNEIWIATDGSGIFAFNTINFNVLANYNQNNPNPYFIETNSIYHILSYNSLVWVCTYTSGIINCQYPVSNYQFISHQRDNVKSIVNSHVNAILEDSNGNIWYGTNSGISKYIPSKDEWIHLLAKNTKGESTVILSLCEDNSGKIWAGGYATNLFCINNKTHAVTPITFDSLARKNYIYSIITDSNNNLWLAGSITKLTCLSPDLKQKKQYNINEINKLYAYNADTILVAAATGLYIVNQRTDKIRFVNFSLSRHHNKQLKTFLNSLYVDQRYPQWIWIGTDGGGLYRFNIHCNEVQIYSNENGLSSNYVYGIQQDNQNRFWISTENGLNCLRQTNGQLHSNIEIEGLPGNTFNFLAYEKCRSGRMIWGTPNGVLSIVPEDFRNSDLSSIQLKFTAFNLFYEKVTTQTPETPLKTPIDETTEIELSNSQRSFSFNFLDINNFSHAQTFYSWRLKGFEKDWSKPSTNHSAVYTNVPSGNFVFELRAFKHGNKNFTARTVQIVIHPPFWATWYAFVIYFMFLLAMGYFVFKYSKNKLEARNSEEKIRFFVNMAHDVRTPITLVKAPLNEIENESLSEDGRSALSLAQRNLDKLFNLITQLLDFQRIENNSMQLSVEETRLNHFIGDITENFILPAKEKNISLDVVLPHSETIVWIDRKKTTLIIDNLLSNALKYTNQNGKIQIKIDIENVNLCIEVADDGVGIPIINQKHLFERFYRAQNVSNSKETGSGIGLMLTKKLVVLHMGKITFNSVERLGTTFRVELPCFRDAYRQSEIIINSFDEAKHDESEPNKPEQAYKILLVEDNDEIRAYLSKQLRNEYEVMEAPSGNEALEMIKNNAPDFILSDIMMPGISGFDLCSILKSNTETSHIPLILVSSLSERNDILKGLSLGADDYITKPFDMKILQSKIKAIIKTRNLFKSKYIAKTVNEEEFSTINEKDKVFITKVISLIEDNLVNESFAIENLAVEMAMSRTVFYKKMKSLTNENPKDFIKEIRMKKAVVLIREKKYQINEIAYLVGFSNPKHFSTFFKKYYGVSPSNYVNDEN
ncbi:MAG: response regulator [Paludibacter sp.]|nr:response regulator [Paludibacter sp.]